MNKVPEQITKRTVVLPDGRYMIFYTVADSDRFGPGDVTVTSPEATPAPSEEEN